MSKMPYLSLSAFLLLLDQLSKWVVTEYLIRIVVEKPDPQSLGFFEWFLNTPPRLSFVSIDILPFFNLVMVWNQGISFGLFNDGGEMNAYILSGLSLVISVIFLIWLFRSESKMQNIGIAFVIAGAFGNIIDRLRFGAVIDFLDFHIAGFHWPAFNVADSCIFIGVLLLIVKSLFFETPQKDAT